MKLTFTLQREGNRKFHIPFFIIIILLSSYIHAQQWVQTRGPGGGDVVDFIEQNGVILSATYGGIYRSTDNGDTWLHSGNGIDDGVFVSTFASTGNYIYGAGTYSGLFRSADNGLNWTEVIVPVSFITKLFASHDTLYVGCDGCGVYRSVGNAASFQQINTGFPAVAIVNSFVQLGSYLYSGLTGNGGSVGVYRTPVNAINWTQVNNGLIVFPSVVDLAVKNNDLWVTVESFNDVGLFRSSNLGATWIEETPAIPGADWPTQLLVAGNDIYCGTNGGVPFKSVDNGASWQIVGNGLKPLSVFCFLAGSAGIFVGYERGIARTTDNGASWQRKILGLTNTSVTSLFADGNTALYASTRTWTMGRSDGIFFTTDGGQNWTAIDSGLLPSPHISTVVKAGGNVIIGGLGLYIKTPADAAFRRPVGIPETVNVNVLMTSGQYVFAGTSGVGEIYRSTDYWLTWAQSNTGLGVQEDQVYSFCEKSGVIYAGAFNALYKSANFGVSWTAAVAGLNSGITITGISVLGNDLFACSRDNRRIYKSNNDGASWVSVNNGLPAIIHFNSIVAANGSLFAGSNLGVYKSDNAGNSWSLFNVGLLPRNNSLSMAIFNGNLFLGTDETSVWAQSLSVLPITLENFSAREENGYVNLYWKTAQEINGKYFDIQRSTDGRNFISLGNINAEGDANGHGYGFIDHDPHHGYNYYRLTMVDMDGNKKYSEVILINLTANASIGMFINPNPARGEATINISGNLKGNATVTAYDMAGKRVADLYAGEINSTAFTTVVNLNAFKKGIYILRLVVNKETVISKLVIQ